MINFRDTPGLIRALPFFYPSIAGVLLDALLVPSVGTGPVRKEALAESMVCFITDAIAIPAAKKGILVMARAPLTIEDEITNQKQTTISTKIDQAILTDCCSGENCGGNISTWRRFLYR